MVAHWLVSIASFFAPPPRIAATLTWVDAANPPATYNVYRGSGECLALPVMAQIKSRITEKEYSDTGVKVNRTYCYTVTATVEAIESNASDKITVFVPKQPTWFKKRDRRYKEIP